MKLTVAWVALSLFSFSLYAEKIDTRELIVIEKEKGVNWHRASEIAYLGAIAADAASSYGGMELNPLWKGKDGTFDNRSLALFVGANVVSVVVQELVLRRLKGRQKERFKRIFSIINVGGVGLHSGVAIRNWRLR